MFVNDHARCPVLKTRLFTSDLFNIRDNGALKMQGLEMQD